MKRHGDPLGGGTGKGAPRAFILEALAIETNDCIEWPYGKKEGYGFLNDGAGGTITASRLVCLMAHGAPADEAMEAAHSCGNRACCNKHHIRWATFLENTSDKYLHGTIPMGEACSSAKLTNENVRCIRARRGAGERLKTIAQDFGITIGHVSDLASGKAWAHLDADQRRDAA